MKLTDQVRSTWWDCYLAGITIRISEESQQLLRVVEESVEAQVAASQGGQADQLRVANEITKIDRDLAEARRVENTAKARLNSFPVSGNREVDLPRNLQSLLVRAETPLDPAPLSMVETVVNYMSEYRSSAKGEVLRFKTDDQGDFVYENESLVPDEDGMPYRQWRPQIKSPDDIWAEMSRVTQLPGVTGAPKLQPIETRLVMLRTGMRAPMGLKIKGPDLRTIEDFGIEIERHLRSGMIKGLNPATVNADRIVGKPYLEIIPDRDAASRYGLNIVDVHDAIQTAIGGRMVTTTVEGRERYMVQVRYMRENRDSIDDLERILVRSKSGAQIPLSQLASTRCVRGPQNIKAEDPFLTGYVTFGAGAGNAEVDVVEAAQAYLKEMEDTGELKRPAGVWVSCDNEAVGILGISDPIKPSSAEAIKTLHALGIRVIMATGDNIHAAEAVGKALGIDEVHAGLSPADKIRMVKELKARGAIVAMAGDGINDAPALAEAQVGVAMGTGTDVAIESAAITLVKGDLQGIARAVGLSRGVMKNIRQNLFFAFAYNALGIPVAAGVLYPFFGILLSPMIAGAAMSFSSLSVILNALRLKKLTIKG